jgi:hypothetical protein
MKATAVFGLQVALALLIVGAGALMVSGVNSMAPAFEGLGYGASPRLLVGTAEIIAGACMLIPRSALLGVAVLITLWLGVSGTIVVNAAASGYRAASAAPIAERRLEIINRNCATHGRAMTCGIRRSPGWDI